MNDEKDTEQIPELQSLVDKYQSTKAPLGFSERVAAHINDESGKHEWSSVLADILGSPRLIAAASIGVIAVLSIMVVQLTIESKPELQIAQQDTTVPKTTIEVESTQITQVMEPINMNQLLEPSTAEGEIANLAVLSDISVWLEEDIESTTPDFTDMPDLAEIDAILDFT
ncbi:hypothetical protein [Kaarinaea lacus]